MTEKLLTIDEVCVKLGGVRPWTIRGWVSQRKIPFTKVGRLTRFPETRINDWITSNTFQPS
jgi:excisionase family DNA binding protein